MTTTFTPSGVHAARRSPVDQPSRADELHDLVEIIHSLGVTVEEEGARELRQLHAASRGAFEAARIDDDEADGLHALANGCLEPTLDGVAVRAARRREEDERPRPLAQVIGQRHGTGRLQEAHALLVGDAVSIQRRRLQVAPRKVGNEGSAMGTKGTGNVAYGFGLDFMSGAPAGVADVSGVALLDKLAGARFQD